MQTPYEELGISKDATPSDIKKAWRKRARETHPDRNAHDPDAANKFKRVRQAYALLANPISREAYDKTGRTDTNKNDPESIAFTELVSLMLTAFENSPDLRRTDIIDLVRRGVMQGIEDHKREGND